MPLILRRDRLNIVSWWVDASYAMHPDFQSHTGMIFSLGWGLVASMYKRQKINPIITMKAELIGAVRVLPEFLWSRYFIEAQKLEVEEAFMYQDNLSAMLLKNNEILSSENRINTYASDTF